MLEDIKKETVDWIPNFDGNKLEPTLIPAALPNLLMNGSEGIAVGMATRIPPHNLRELTAATVAALRLGFRPGRPASRSSPATPAAT